MGRPSRTAVLVCAATLGAALVALWALDPATSGVFPPCPFSRLTGLLCPGCGGLRATHALLHGDVARAFALNPLYVVALPFCTAWLAWIALAAFSRVRAPPRVGPRAMFAFVAVALLYGVARNLV